MQPIQSFNLFSIKAHCEKLISESSSVKKNCLQKFFLPDLTEMNGISLNATFHFLVVEDQPLMSSGKVWILTVLALLILFVGLFVQARIFVMLKKRKSEGAAVAIDRLFRANNLLHLTLQPPFFVYIIASYFLFPMSYYIGTLGCGLLPHFLQVFINIYCLLFPVSVALTRFAFVVCGNWTKSFGINRLVNIVTALSFIIPAIMTLSLQFPAFDYIHFPFNYCLGRFEIVFNPTHHDPITPGTSFLQFRCNSQTIYLPICVFEFSKSIQYSLSFRSFLIFGFILVQNYTKRYIYIHTVFIHYSQIQNMRYFHKTYLQRIRRVACILSLAHIVRNQI